MLTCGDVSLSSCEPVFSSIHKHRTTCTAGLTKDTDQLPVDERHDGSAHPYSGCQPDPEEESRREDIRRRIAKLDDELDRYRTIVRNEPDAAAMVGRWIAETTRERRPFEALLFGHPTTRLTKEDIKALVASLRDIAATLTEADKATVYTEMGITLTYQQDGRVLVEFRPGVVKDGVGGGT